MLCGINLPFGRLFPSIRQVAHVLLTRPPLGSSPKGISSLDLHVLGTPPAFVLSQDQTLNKKFNLSQITLSLSFKTSKRIAGLFYLTYFLFNFQRPFFISFYSTILLSTWVIISCRKMLFLHNLFVYDKLFYSYLYLLLFSTFFYCWYTGISCFIAVCFIYFI